MGIVVIVANETLAGADLRAAVEKRIAAGCERFHLVVPVPLGPPPAIAVGMATTEVVVITDLESRLGVRFTADTLSQLMRIYPTARFVWLMGADNMSGFHRWEHWDWIMESVPIGVMARPGAQLRAGLAPAAQRYARWRVPPSCAAGLPFMSAPAWCLLTGPMSTLSSTAIRASGGWP